MMKWLAFFCCFLTGVGVYLCFDVLPWFEYQVTWSPPKVGSSSLIDEEELKESLRLFQYSPDAYPVLPNGEIGCFLNGACQGCLMNWPSRLHRSYLDTAQIRHIQTTRLLISLALGCCALLAFPLALLHLRRWVLEISARRRPIIGIVLAFLFFALAGVLFLFGPAIYAFGFTDPLPEPDTCLPAPGVVQCEHFTGNSTMAWRGQEAQWRYQGLALTGILGLGISYGLTLIAGLLFFYKPGRIRGK